MTATLHLIDGRANPLRLRQVQQTLAEQDVLLLMGGATMAYAADVVGLHGYQRLSTPFADARFGLPSLRRFLKQHATLDRYAWTPTTAAATRWLRYPARSAPLDLPAPTVPAISADQRQAIRRAWQLPDHGKMIALLADQPDDADAYRAMLAVALAYEASGERLDLRLLVTPRQRGRLHARRMLDEFGVAHMLKQDSRLAAPWTILPACDLALCLGPKPPGEAARYAEAANLPLVCESDRPGDLRQLAHALERSAGEMDEQARRLNLGDDVSRSQQPV